MRDYLLAVKAHIPPEKFIDLKKQLPIDAISGLSGVAGHNIKAAGYKYIGELTTLTEKDLKQFYSVSKKTIEKIQTELEIMGLSLKK